VLPGHINHRETPNEMTAATVLYLLKEVDPLKIKGWDKELLSAYYKKAMVTIRQREAREKKA